MLMTYTCGHGLAPLLVLTMWVYDMTIVPSCSIGENVQWHYSSFSRCHLYYFKSSILLDLCRLSMRVASTSWSCSVTRTTPRRHHLLDFIQESTWLVLITRPGRYSLSLSVALRYELFITMPHDFHTILDATTALLFLSQLLLGRVRISWKQFLIRACLQLPETTFISSIYS